MLLILHRSCGGRRRSRPPFFFAWQHQIQIGNAQGSYRHYLSPLNQVRLLRFVERVRLGMVRETIFSWILPAGKARDPYLFE